MNRAPAKPQKTDTSEPHYSGHRQRLRERFINSGPDSLQDYELVELFLFLAIPRRDVKPLAKKLLARFGSIADLVNASVHDLKTVEGVSENTAAAIKTLCAMSHRMLKQGLMNRPILNSWSRLMDYAHATMAHEKNEIFRILFMNKKNELIADEIQGTGTIDHTPAYPREIVRRALELGASALILMHNHPSGDPKPSRDDVDMTNAIIAVASPFAISIHDHVIVSRKGYTSFRNEGLIT